MRTSRVSERYEYIRGKSSHLIEVLSRKMLEFDKLVMKYFPNMIKKYSDELAS